MATAAGSLTYEGTALPNGLRIVTAPMGERAIDRVLPHVRGRIPPGASRP